MREAWKKIYGEYPSDKSLAVLWAKSCLETGWWKYIHCFNFGNIKKRRATKFVTDDGHYFTMYRCSEVLNGKEYYFDPPHYQTHFCAYKKVEDGAEHYIEFVSKKKRYAKAWEEVIKGDPRAYSHELKKAGYYTATESRYTAGVVRLFDKFMANKEEYLAWRPAPDTDPSPPPVEVEEELDTDIDNEIPDPYDIPSLRPLEGEDEIDTEVFNDLPEDTSVDDAPVSSNSRGRGGAITMIIAALGGLGVLLSQLLQSCQ